MENGSYGGWPAAKNTPSHKNGGTSHKKEQASHKNSHSSYKNKFQLITCTLQKDTATYSDSAFSFRSTFSLNFQEAARFPRPES
jgi:hypothetical protein